MTFNCQKLEKYETKKLTSLILSEGRSRPHILYKCLCISPVKQCRYVYYKLSQI